MSAAHPVAGLVTRDGAVASIPVASSDPSATLHQYFQTLAWTFAAIGFCVLAYVIEKYLVMQQWGLITDSTHRMFKNPAELPMRLFGLPHFIVGISFMLTSRRMRGVRSFAWLIGLSIAGVVLSWLFYTFGRSGDTIHPFAMLLFYFYFLIHGFRDEAFFYKSYNEMPKGAEGQHDRIMVILQLLLLGLLLALGLPAYALYGQFKPEFKHPALEAIFPANWPYAIRFFSLLAPMTLIAIFALRRIANNFPDGLRGLWRVHRPILTVFLISTCIILIALVSGPWTFNAVVLMHFVAWYIFARHMIERHPPKVPPRSLWAKMRQTKGGFAFFHIGIAVVAVAAVAISTYAFGKTGTLELIVGSKSFYYWTIMHVTLSFFPR